MEKLFCALELNMDRSVKSGSTEALRAAIKNAADLRIYTEFRHNEHIDLTSDNDDLIREVSDFPETVLIEGDFAAAMMTFRQPVQLPDSFGPRASMSFFMYSQDGTQAVARPFLDGKGANGVPFEAGCDESKYHLFDTPDWFSNAPCINFIYDFYAYRYLVRDDWTEIYSHDRDGNAVLGSARLLEEASAAGRELKVGITGIFEGVGGNTGLASHEVFLNTGAHYFYSREGVMVAQTRPFVRAIPQKPMRYEADGWDFGWCVIRSDGRVSGLFYDGKTLTDHRFSTRCAMRWFMR